MRYFLCKHEGEMMGYNVPLALLEQNKGTYFTYLKYFIIPTVLVHLDCHNKNTLCLYFTYFE